MMGRTSVGAILAAIVLGLAACADVREPIVVEEGTITVENLTDSDWKNVRVVVNDHYNGGVPVLTAGQRLNAPLSQFQTGLGHRYDRGRMSVFKVEVTATDSAGRPVTLRWGEDKKR